MGRVNCSYHQCRRDKLRSRKVQQLNRSTWAFPLVPETGDRARWDKLRSRRVQKPNHSCWVSHCVSMTGVRVQAMQIALWWECEHSSREWGPGLDESRELNHWYHAPKSRLSPISTRVAEMKEVVLKVPLGMVRPNVTLGRKTVLVRH